MPDLLSQPVLYIPSSYRSSRLRQHVTVSTFSHHRMPELYGSNTHSHRIGQLKGAFGGEENFTHVKPLEYAFEFRHWRDLLLQEQGVHEDENEAHIFDLDSGTLALLISTYDYEMEWDPDDDDDDEPLSTPSRFDNKPRGDSLDRIMSCWPKSTRKGIPTANIFDDAFGWFVRTEREGINSSKPVTSFRDLVEAIVKNRPAVADLHRVSNPSRLVASDDASLAEFWKPKTISVYLSPWKPTLSPNPKTWPPTGMWRVFVPPPGHDLTPEPFRISAISQLHCNHAYRPGSRVVNGDQMIGFVAHQIFHVCLRKIEQVLDSSLDMDGVKRQFRQSGFVFDVFESSAGEQPVVRILDIKPFGALSNTRSCTFNWIQHAQLLYGMDLDHNGSVRMVFLS